MILLYISKQFVQKMVKVGPSIETLNNIEDKFKIIFLPSNVTATLKPMTRESMKH